MKKIVYTCPHCGKEFPLGSFAAKAKHVAEHTPPAKPKQAEATSGKFAGK